MFKFWKKNKDDRTDTGFRDDFTETDEFALPSWARTSLYVLTSFFIIILCWACISKIDKIVKAEGKLVTIGHEIVVRPLVDSLVKSIDVRVGQLVKKDQKILTLDPTFAQSDLAQVNIRIEYAKAAIYRAQCELNHGNYVIPKKDPYGKGWLVVIDPVSGLRSKTRKLLFEQKAVSWLNTEAKKLDEIVMNVYGVPLAATGGEIVDDIYGNLPDIKWEDLVHTFLLT
jgi:hypothetical protein